MPVSKQETSKTPLVRELTAIAYWMVALFVGLSLFVPHTTGMLGHWLVDVGLTYLLGKSVWTFPFVVAGIGITFFSSHRSIARICAYTFVVLNLFSIAFEMYLATAGGAVGKAWVWLLEGLVGRNGIWVGVITAGLMVLVMLCDISMIQVVRWVLQKVKIATKACIFYLKNLPWETIKQRLFYTTVNSQNVPVIEKPVVQEPVKKATLKSEPVKKPFEFIVQHEPAPEPAEELTEHKAQPQLFSNKHSNVLPSLDLLEKPSKQVKETKVTIVKRDENARLLEEALASFGVQAKVVHITPGPSVTRYELQPGSGVKISKITALAKDIALQLAVVDVRIEAPIPGKALIGIEVPNTEIEMVMMRNIIESSSFLNHPSKLMCAMGLTITGEPVMMDLGKMPHILIAGATGSGKSVCVNSIITSILMRATPDEVKFLMIDPKKVELSLYDGIPHLVAPVVTNPQKAAASLKQWALIEMERRYEEFANVGVKDIQGFNDYVKSGKSAEPMRPIPYIVVVIDELADLMMVAAQDVESTICRLAQMSRATGIHLVIATQRPSVNVITGLIKANVPSRISFFLQSQIDSRTILDMPGAEKLLGKGDMLYSPVGSFKPKRVQGVYLSEKEIKQVVAFLKQQGSPDYILELLNVEPLVAEAETKEGAKEGLDELFEEAKQIVINTRYASTSYLQRKLRIGYNRAARLMDELEQQGVISEYVGERKARNVLPS